MSPRIAPLTLSTASDTTRPLLEGLKKALGMVPQLYATIGQAPGALKGLLAFGDALDQQGKLSRREVELVSLHASELNGCGYCVAAHGAL
ncbi:MAG TPA: carboxymuconolactone decarboxylase family protein, partial [Myxococcaceae bacterium]|nr:carboxymuconolactone decarboxylase family protein [Myxococcaceae bacterium]